MEEGPTATNSCVESGCGPLHGYAMLLSRLPDPAFMKRTQTISLTDTTVLKSQVRAVP